MIVVYDDWHVIDAGSVACLQKPCVEDATYGILKLTLKSGVTVVLKFESIDARDSCFKQLIDAMQKVS